MKIMGDNLLSFLDIFTTAAEDDAGVEATTSIANARWAALVWGVFGIIVGPLVHEKVGFKRLV